MTSRTTMETYTGNWVDFDHFEPRMVKLVDVSKALSQICRFGGHIPWFYSVASHALTVKKLVEHELGRPDLALAALHHDSHEAYIGDIPTPLKRAAGEGFKRLAGSIDYAIKDAFGIDADFNDPVIQEADELALRAEAWVLKRSGGVQGAWQFREPPPILAEAIPLSSRETYARFIQEHISCRAPVYA